MKTKLLYGASILVTGLIGLAWAQQGGPPGPGNDDRPPPPPPFHGPGPIMMVLDTDKDGQLSAAEIANAPTALATLDKNHDGTITKEELRPPPPPNGKPGGHILRLDKDGDGKVSLEEFLAPPKDAFAHIDTNHDGVIDADEAAAAPPPPPPHGPPPGFRGGPPNNNQQQDGQGPPPGGRHRAKSGTPP